MLGREIKPWFVWEDGTASAPLIPAPLPWRKPGLSKAMPCSASSDGGFQRWGTKGWIYGIKTHLKESWWQMMFVTGRDVTFGKLQPPHKHTQSTQGKWRQQRSSKVSGLEWAVGSGLQCLKSKLKTPQCFTSLPVSAVQVTQLPVTELNPFPFNNQSDDLEPDFKPAIKCWRFFPLKFNLLRINPPSLSFQGGLITSGSAAPGAGRD